MSKRMIMVPTISSGTAGPLGAKHLPRLWAKNLLARADRLPDGYDAIGAGFDMMTLNALGIDRDAFSDFMDSDPSYIELEAWIKQQPGAKFDAATIDAHNAAIEGYIHADATRKEILAADGLNDESCLARSAVQLNNLDDWKAFHSHLVPNADVPAQAVEEDAPAQATTAAEPALATAS
jgi:hypothetical protein